MKRTGFRRVTALTRRAGGLLAAADLNNTRQALELLTAAEASFREAVAAGDLDLPALGELRREMASVSALLRNAGELLEGLGAGREAAAHMQTAAAVDCSADRYV